MDQLHLTALSDRIEADIEQGSAKTVIGELEVLVGHHPYHEQFLALQMRALYLAGRQIEALAAYRHARETLVGRYGIEPSEQLRTLERAIPLRTPPCFLPPRTPTTRIRGHSSRCPIAHHRRRADRPKSSGAPDTPHGITTAPAATTLDGFAAFSPPGSHRGVSTRRSPTEIITTAPATGSSTKADITVRRSLRPRPTAGALPLATAPIRSVTRLEKG